MDRKTLGIGILSLTAAALLALNFCSWTPATAEVVASSRDYQVVTSNTQAGGENLYILDNKTGLVAAFVWDAGTRSMAPRAVRPMADAFTQQ
jgi:hypothetical protein